MNYLYDTVELPQLPDYDKTKYPYAIIKEESGIPYGVDDEVFYVLIVCSVPLIAKYPQLEGFPVYIYAHSPCSHSNYWLFPTQRIADAVLSNPPPVNHWFHVVDREYQDEGEELLISSKDNLIWTNHDIYYTDNKICRSSKIPISTTLSIELSTLRQWKETIKRKTGSIEAFVAVNSFNDRMSLIEPVILDYEQDYTGENFLPSVVDESKIYKTPSVMFFVYMGIQSMTIEALLKNALGISPKIYYHFVDTLPDTFSEAFYSYINTCIHLFVLNDTGVAYVLDNYNPQTGEVVDWHFKKATDVFNYMSQGTLGGELVDGGYCPDDIDQCQPLHCYIQRIPEKVGIPNADGNRKIYQYSDGAWVELVPKTEA